MSLAWTESCNDAANDEEIPPITDTFLSNGLYRRLIFENDKDLWKISCYC